MTGLLRSLDAVMIFSKSQQFFVWGRKCLWVAMAKSAIAKKNEKGNPVFGENDDDEKMKTLWLRKMAGATAPKQKER